MPSMEDLERAEDATLTAFSNALELQDVEVLYHSRRVTAFAVALARAMRLPRDITLVIARGAFLHDIGKITTPGQEHVYAGYQLLRNIQFLAEAAEIVYAHHENWDGTGYPRNLKGSDIPLGARIVAIVDALDHDKTYDDARDEIGRGAGRRFDPEVVNVFLTLPESIWSSLAIHLDSLKVGLTQGF